MDKLWLGLSTMLVGMLVVFLGLIILIGCITLMGMIIGGRKKKKTEAEISKATENLASAPAAVTEAVQEVAAEDDGALVAAITAAIAAVWQNENSGFVVRRIKRYPAARQ